MAGSMLTTMKYVCETVSDTADGSAGISIQQFMLVFRYLAERLVI